MSHQYDLRKQLSYHSQNIDDELKNIIEIINGGENFTSKKSFHETGKNLSTIDINNHITFCDNTIEIMTELKKKI